MQKEPIVKFNQWWKNAVEDSPLNQKSAVCISTIDPDGFPDGRFVDLKAVSDDGFVFCTYLDSNKGSHLQLNSKAALTAWWDHVGLQVRVVGQANPISIEEARLHWQSRSVEAQLTTLSCQQSQVMEDQQQLISSLRANREKYSNEDIPMPENWGGYCIKPTRIEFLKFEQSRLHVRELYMLKTSGWTRQLLQP